MLLILSVYCCVWPKNEKEAAPKVSAMGIEGRGYLAVDVIVYGVVEIAEYISWIVEFDIYGVNLSIIAVVEWDIVLLMDAISRFVGNAAKALMKLKRSAVFDDEIRPISESLGNDNGSFVVIDCVSAVTGPGCSVISLLSSSVRRGVEEIIWEEVSIDFLISSVWAESFKASGYSFSIGTSSFSRVSRLILSKIFDKTVACGINLYEKINFVNSGEKKGGALILIICGGRNCEMFWYKWGIMNTLRVLVNSVTNFMRWSVILVNSV